ncbi:hypothetical protein TRFO_18126 [Tritrichomonas foetus]|uniref:Uncharacterized protein n=1 Tax=Tritrichomonas foetus TaxID=1144522 RepID=A0A1J4KRX0_9EUKA|nr:hypothetical protein TRFO_18126 [Tritrichomonas foetus]|eukprot:OHT12213.1 hypothetical protein TRFO_18126 [Tritrichomonas foetus]
MRGKKTFSPQSYKPKTYSQRSKSISLTKNRNLNFSIDSMNQTFSGEISQNTKLQNISNVNHTKKRQSSYNDSLNSDLLSKTLSSSYYRDGLNKDKTNIHRKNLKTDVTLDKTPKPIDAENKNNSNNILNDNKSSFQKISLNNSNNIGENKTVQSSSSSSAKRKRLQNMTLHINSQLYQNNDKYFRIKQFIILTRQLPKNEKPRIYINDKPFEDDLNIDVLDIMKNIHSNDSVSITTSFEFVISNRIIKHCFDKDDKVSDAINIIKSQYNISGDFQIYNISNLFEGSIMKHMNPKMTLYKHVYENSKLCLLKKNDLIVIDSQNRDYCIIEIHENFTGFDILREYVSTKKINDSGKMLDLYSDFKKEDRLNPNNMIDGNICSRHFLFIDIVRYINVEINNNVRQIKFSESETIESLKNKIITQLAPLSIDPKYSDLVKTTKDILQKEKLVKRYSHSEKIIFVILYKFSWNTQSEFFMFPLNSQIKDIFSLKSNLNYDFNTVKVNNEIITDTNSFIFDKCYKKRIYLMKLDVIEKVDFCFNNKFNKILELPKSTNFGIIKSYFYFDTNNSLLINPDTSLRNNFPPMNTNSIKIRYEEQEVNDIDTIESINYQNDKQILVLLSEWDFNFCSISGKFYNTFTIKSNTQVNQVIRNIYEKTGKIFKIKAGIALLSKDDILENYINDKKFQPFTLILDNPTFSFNYNNVICEFQLPNDCIVGEAKSIIAPNVKSHRITMFNSDRKPMNNNEKLLPFQTFDIKINPMEYLFVYENLKLKLSIDDNMPINLVKELLMKKFNIEKKINDSLLINQDANKLEIDLFLFDIKLENTKHLTDYKIPKNCEIVVQPNIRNYTFRIGKETNIYKLFHDTTFKDIKLAFSQTKSFDTNKIIIKRIKNEELHEQKVYQFRNDDYFLVDFCENNEIQIFGQLFYSQNRVSDLRKYLEEKESKKNVVLKYCDQYLYDNIKLCDIPNINKIEYSFNDKEVDDFEFIFDGSFTKIVTNPKRILCFTYDTTVFDAKCVLEDITCRSDISLTINNYLLDDDQKLFVIGNLINVSIVSRGIKLVFNNKVFRKSLNLNDKIINIKNSFRENNIFGKNVSCDDIELIYNGNVLNNDSMLSEYVSDLIPTINMNNSYINTIENTHNNDNSTENNDSESAIYIFVRQQFGDKMFESSYNLGKPVEKLIFHTLNDEIFSLDYDEDTKVVKQIKEKLAKLKKADPVDFSICITNKNNSMFCCIYNKENIRKYFNDKCILHIIEANNNIDIYPSKIKNIPDEELSKVLSYDNANKIYKKCGGDTNLFIRTIVHYRDKIIMKNCAF